MFAELCPDGVSDVYRKTKSGKSLTSDKQAFSPIILSNLLKAAQLHIKERKMNYEDEISDAVVLKLSNFNSLFRKLKDEAKYSENLVTKCKLNRHDVVNLKGFDEFKFQPKKFAELNSPLIDSTSAIDSNRSNLTEGVLSIASRTDNSDAIADCSTSIRGELLNQIEDGRLGLTRGERWFEKYRSGQIEEERPKFLSGKIPSLFT